MTVLMRLPIPTSAATWDASITQHAMRLSITCCCTERGSWSHTRSGGYGLLSRNVAPGLARSRIFISLEQPEVVARDEVGVVDQVGRANRLRPEAQMRHGDRPGLLGVVDEVALREQVGVLTDDLDRALVGADGSVGSEPDEHGLHLAGRARAM